MKTPRPAGVSRIRCERLQGCSLAVGQQTRHNGASRRSLFASVFQLLPGVVTADVSFSNFFIASLVPPIARMTALSE